MKIISYVIPVYHNQGSIRLTWEGITKLFQGALSEYDYEVIFVDDGSKDDSYAEMKEVAALDKKVRLVRFSRNFGQVPAIVAGYEHSHGDAVVNMSADLQDPVELTVEMVRSYEEGNEVVVAYREGRDDSFAATMFSRIAYAALRSSNPNIPAGGFDFTLMSRRALNVFLSLKGRNRFFQGDILWAGFRTAFFPYLRRKREVGKSQYNFSKKLKLFYDFLLDGSYMPIRLMSLAGITTGLLGILYAFAIVALWLFDRTPFSGWAPIMVVILLIGGAIMFMLSVIGEYLWRILDEIKAKPMYIVKEEE